MNISEINGNTALYAILGDPVVQVSTPGLINRIFAEKNEDKVLLHMHLQANSFAEAVHGLWHIKNFRGAVITMPHKSSIVPLLDEISAKVAQTQSCNVIRRTQEGKLFGHMLDGEGFVAGLKAEGHAVARKRAFLMGAGVAASGIAFVLCKHGVEQLLIYNRNPKKAEALIERLKLAISLAGQVDKNIDLLINATSVGMKDDDATLLSLEKLDQATLGAEVIIRPEMTCTLKEAVRLGCQIHPGIHMLKAQIRLMLEFMD
jgi:shikimate dehydrogenase